jgi:ATP-dependent DNA helicase RecG
VLVEIVNARAMRFRRNASMCVATIKDDTGEATAKWFGRAYLKKQLEPGRHILLTGTVGNYKGLCINNPDYRIYDDPADAEDDIGRMVPIYPLTEGITQRMLRPLVVAALERVEAPADILPREQAAAFGFATSLDALRAVHMPETAAEAERAQQRFTYARLLASRNRNARRRRRPPESDTRSMGQRLNRIARRSRST